MSPVPVPPKKHGPDCFCPVCEYDRHERPAVPDTDDGTIRKFATGATRDTAQDKPDYEGFLSPAVLIRFGEYMDANRKQSDGSLRASDNWQKGIPQEQYVKSLLRHVVDVWAIHRGVPTRTEDIEESLCAIIFNASGLLFEKLKEV